MNFEPICNQQIWFGSPLGFRFDNQDNEPFINWLIICFINTAPKEMVELGASIIYGIWEPAQYL